MKSFSLFRKTSICHKEPYRTGGAYSISDGISRPNLFQRSAEPLQYSGKYSRRGIPRQMPYTERGRSPFCGAVEEVPSCHDGCELVEMANEEELRFRNADGDVCDHYHSEWCDRHFSLAMAYVYPQEFRDLYDTEEALCHGTLFRELDMPFYGARKRT